MISSDQGKGRKNRNFKTPKEEPFQNGVYNSNYKHCRDSVRAWKDDGFDIRFFDVPAMGHGNAPKDAFEEALDWVKEGRKAAQESSTRRSTLSPRSRSTR